MCSVNSAGDFPGDAAALAEAAESVGAFAYALGSLDTALIVNLAPWAWAWAWAWA